MGTKTKKKAEPDLRSLLTDSDTELEYVMAAAIVEIAEYLAVIVDQIENGMTNA